MLCFNKYQISISGYPVIRISFCFQRGTGVMDEQRLYAAEDFSGGLQDTVKYPTTTYLSTDPLSLVMTCLLPSSLCVGINQPHNSTGPMPKGNRRP